MSGETEAGLEIVLEQLADYTLNTHNYQTIHNALNNEKCITKAPVDKLLSICIRALKEDRKYTVNTLNIILSIIKKVNDGQCVTVPDLVPSALAVLHLLQTTVLFSKVEALKILCFEILLAYPDETLVSIAVNQGTEFMELFNSYCHQRIPVDIRLQPVNLLAKLLKILPPDKRRQFVKHGVSVWFSKIVPTVVLYVNSLNAKVDVPVEALEMLTDELVHVEYVDNPQWQIVLECIYTPQRYPSIMKCLLEKDNVVWCNLWMIFIRLLKNQITKVSNTVKGSPINSMLPVVELAFKMNPENRCRAFKCWNVLIDNFSTETSDLYINKRIKLLIIPLSSNNAKVVETAMAKLNTWWHLIAKFNVKLQMVADIALIPFIYFCFGKPNTDKPVLIPGTLSEELKYKCVEAITEIFGHTSDCDCKISLPRLDKKLVTGNLLVSHWREWLHAVDSSIKIYRASNKKEIESYIKCIWHSLLSTINDLTESKLKRDLYYEVLNYLDSLCLGVTNVMGKMLLETFIPSLFNNQKELSKIKIDECPLEQKVISMLLRLPRDVLVVRPEYVNELRIVTDLFLEEKSTLTLNTIEHVIEEVSTKGLLIWTALAHSMCKTKYTSNTKALCQMLLCPLEKSTLNATSFSAWLDLYGHVFGENSTINDDILNIISHNDKLEYYYAMTISLEMVKQKLKNCNDGQGTTFDKELDNLRKMTDWFCEIENFEDAPKDLTDWYCEIDNFEDIIKVIVGVCSKLNTIDDDSAFENVMTVATNVLEHSLQHNIFQESRIFENLENLFRNIELVENKEKYMKTKPQIINKIKDVGAKFLDKLEPYHKQESITKLKSFLDSIYCNGKTVFDNKISFVEPEKTLSATKKSKKKEATIVNTVTDQGEEYVVVKSNWKLSLKKFTDNQKEKFKRKREDIPALYQDLSQSQDEFKTWKTDSQDTSSTSKSTTVSNEDVSSILKNFPNSEIVPKILENMKPTPDKNISITDNGIIPKDNEIEKNKKNLALIPSAKDAKSPRMALKDRVFRNVRNLIEKSNVTNGNISLNCDLIESGPKTPVSKKPEDSNNVVNSAPPKISTERPSRQKRKPKKFEDLQLFGLKKRRQSLGQNDSPSETDTGDEKDDRNAESTDYKSFSEKPTGEEALTSNKIVQDSENVHLLSENIEPLNNAIVAEEQNTIQSEPKSDDTNKSNTVNCAILKQHDTTEKTEIVTDIDVHKLATSSNENEMKNSSLDDFEVKVSTPKLKGKVSEAAKLSNKKSSKKSRIEKELAIDMVEGHPLLNAPTETRVTRKRLLNTPNSRRSKSDKTPNKLETREIKSVKNDTKNKDKCKDSLPLQREDTFSSDDTPSSQDVIESSQDSSITTISVKSSISSKKIPTVIIDKLSVSCIKTQDLINDNVIDESKVVDVEATVEKSNTTFDIDDNKDDTELPRNKTASEDTTFIDLTENMDTEPISQNKIFDDVIVIEDEAPEIMKDLNTEVGPETQEIAEADTQSMDPYADIKKAEIITDNVNDSKADNATEAKDYALDVTPNITQSIEDVENQEKTKFSPFKDEEQRQKDFLNNTIEISPIKTLSPVGETKSSTQDTSSDYVVIKLKSPVQSNGEPFDKCDSPEIFTEEQKISPDKRNLSPPREEITVTNTSPSLALKKRPQVRSGGRGAQMLGLCVPNRLQTSEKMDVEEKKSTPINTSARRNLRIMYNSTTENNDTTEEDDSDSFLNFKRTLPSVDCSPSGPILKRKLCEITDDATVSPASKRKRVSFHDPPVSTTICVKKYIEPGGIRSPQNSAIKRQERQLRSQIATKSPKRLDNLFKLDTVLTKTIESFVDENTSKIPNEDTPMSLDPTPVVEIVKTSELNDTDPICSQLADCKDTIEKIAGQLSSNTMKELLVKEFEGKINTVGDLAKMTELEVNRLCIKSPKVEVARKVLTEYAEMLKQAREEITPTVEEAMSESLVPELMAMEVQTDSVLVDNVAMQTDILETSEKHVQSDSLPVSHCSTQTDESGSKTTEDLVKLCIKKEDFLQHLCDETDEAFKKDVAENLPADTLTDILLKKMTSTNSTEVVNRLMDRRLTLNSQEENLLALREYICDKFESKDLILFCSEILKHAHNKIT